MLTHYKDLRKRGKGKRVRRQLQLVLKFQLMAEKMLLKQVNNTNSDRSDSRGSNLAAERETLLISFHPKLVDFNWDFN